MSRVQPTELSHSRQPDSSCGSKIEDRARLDGAGSWEGLVPRLVELGEAYPGLGPGFAWWTYAYECLVVVSVVIKPHNKDTCSFWLTYRLCNCLPRGAPTLKRLRKHWGPDWSLSAARICANPEEILIISQSQYCRSGWNPVVDNLKSAIRLRIRYSISSIHRPDECYPIHGKLIPVGTQCKNLVKHLSCGIYESLLSVDRFFIRQAVNQEFILIFFI